METWASLKPDADFNQINQIFPDGKVPIKSMVPIIPRDAENPPCYVVDANFLSSEQIQALAEGLYEMWQPECKSVQMAIDYIRRGLPLKCEYFSGVTTTSQAALAMMLDDPTIEDILEDEDDEEDWYE
ncbi:hypothetical protein [Calothrix sp. PCC 7507]|uniref:hypothetical protein n=1 Tax=Calothrix sp. PCC 7507 TaxID=99598 RepID=UPI0003028360|nr:hypothetical protein [Calothrix sp. PCC 7507]